MILSYAKNPDFERDRVHFAEISSEIVLEDIKICNKKSHRNRWNPLMPCYYLQLSVHSGFKMKLRSTKMLPDMLGTIR